MAAEEAPRSGRRKTRDGMVISTKMDKTAVIEVTDRSRHPQYNKTVQRRTKYYAHDEENTLNEGDRVRIVETRPLSAKKRWRLLEILERAR
ncbi:MAG: 30S ribosomal protein S17 [Actinomycetota bacterium]